MTLCARRMMRTMVIFDVHEDDNNDDGGGDYDDSFGYDS